MTRTQRSYDIFARYYDLLKFDEFSRGLIHSLDEILTGLNFHGKKVLDLGCGTGTSAIWFAHQGYKVTGVDSSPEMIKQARQKARRQKVHIDFRVMDFRHLSGLHHFDLVISLFDTLNHITDMTELETVFRDIYACLNSNQFFLFDMITPYELSRHWNNSVIVQKNNNVTLTFSSKYSKKNKITAIRGQFLIKQAHNILKYHANFQNKAYTRVELKRLFKLSGFKLVDTFDCYSLDGPKPFSRRLLYILQK